MPVTAVAGRKNPFLLDKPLDNRSLVLRLQILVDYKDTFERGAKFFVSDPNGLVVPKLLASQQSEYWECYQYS
jgi:hypothetical protein